MDESLELPNAHAKPVADGAQEDNEQSSDEEDGGLDWTKLLYNLFHDVHYFD
jgi:tRNA-splicing endonuclease subunit Sen54